MEDICEVCGQAPSPMNPVASFMEMGGHNEAARDEIRLCKACVRQREIHNWDRRGSQARALRAALHGRSSPHGRFAYLEDTRRIRLVRLRHGWISAHAAVTTS